MIRKNLSKCILCTFLLILLSLGIPLAFMSCERETSSQSFPSHRRAVFVAGEEISNELFIIAGDSVQMNDDWINHRKITFSPDETEFSVPSYDNLAFIMYVIKTEVEFSLDSSDGGMDKYDAFLDNLSESIDKERPRRIQEYFYAGIREGARVTADQVLFGKEPGDDLGGFFKMELFSEQKIVASYPDFGIVHNFFKQPRQILFSDLFTEQTALSSSPYRMCFLNAPPEHYEEITFHFTIPIETEYMKKIIYNEDYPENWYKENYLERNENRVLRGSVKIKFSN
jgi:hypothetical protein